MESTVSLATLCLNEMEWLPKLYEQHKDWPGLKSWTFVEGADKEYARVNPTLVSANYLSTDGTTEYLTELAKQDDRVTFIQHGMGQHTDTAQGKCVMRQRYLNVNEVVQPKYLIVLDADEFWPKNMQSAAVETMEKAKEYSGFCFKHREIWYPPAMINLHRFSYEVKGGFWDIPYARCWRWQPEMVYVNNHNTPEVRGVGLDLILYRADRMNYHPYYVHMAFASDPKLRAAKHRYYESRGEAKDMKRRWYTESRRAFETWTPGAILPHDSKMVSYLGQVPECFS